MLTPLILFLVGIIASFVSGMIGGGSGLILTPAQLLLGIDPRIATTSTHFGFIGVSLGAMARFRREGDIRAEFTLPLTAISLISGLCGPYLLMSIDSSVLQRIVGALILICVPLFLLKGSLGMARGSSSRARLLIGYVVFFLILLLQVAFGAATGVIAIFVLVYFFGLSMIETSAALRLPNLVSSLVGLMVYQSFGQLDFTYGVTLLIAMALGGYLGSHVAIKGGNRLVKGMFCCLAVVLAVLLVAN